MPQTQGIPGTMHTIKIEPTRETDGNQRYYTYGWVCTCGAKDSGYEDENEAMLAATEHIAKQKI